jgi:hypothetical protein
VATDLRNLPANVFATADFRAWGSGIAAQLAAIGLVKTSDSGQINWATVVPPASGAYAGYEIWRFNDALQATKPVFIRLDYGIGGSGSSTSPALLANVGTSTDGAGTLTGQISAITPSRSYNQTAGIMSPSYCSGGSNRLNLCNNFDPATTYHLSLYIERTKDASGVDTGDGIVIYRSSGNDPGSPRYQFVPFSGSIPAGATYNNALAIGSGGLPVVGSDVALSPHTVFFGKALYTTWCAYRYSDMTKLVPITLTHLGASHTYMPLGDSVSMGNEVLNGVTGYAIAMLWE